MNYPTVKYVYPLSNYRLFLIFDNGDIKIYDFKSRSKGAPFEVLGDEQLFQSVHIEVGGYGVVWNDDLDLSEYELWKNGVVFSSLEHLAEERIV
ncbi:MAG: DUF2442 domain-containing protein [Bacteroidota bacterium]